MNRRTRPIPIATALLVAATVCLAHAAASAQPVEDPDRSLDRLGVAAGFGLFASYPGAMEDPAPTVEISQPIWYGERYRYFQWMANAAVTGGLGTTSRNGYVVASPRFGFVLTLGSVFGYEQTIGPAAIAQVGEHNVVAAGFSSSGGYVLRLWDDDRRRLKLGMTINVGAVFAHDNDNDMGVNPSAIGGITYEAPF